MLEIKNFINDDDDFEVIKLDEIYKIRLIYTLNLKSINKIS